MRTTVNLKIVLLLLCLLISCATPVVHKINFSKEFNPVKIRRIAIMNFNRGDQISLHQDVIVDKFTAALVDASFKIMDRADIKKIMEEAKFQHAASEIIDETTKQKLRQLGADSIITGTLHIYKEDRKGNFINYAEVYLTAKLLKVETGEVLWSAEIYNKSRAKNVGEKKLLKVIDREAEADSAGKLLDDIISEMADSLKEKKSIVDRLKKW